MSDPRIIPSHVMVTKKGNAPHPDYDPAYAIKFTGGEGLTGVEAVVHQAMMKNELAGGRRAYALSFAGGNSGYSFGANQMDILGNADALPLFQDILEKSEMAEVERTAILDVVQFKPDDDTPIAEYKSLTPTQRRAANGALSSDYGREKINEAYRPEISSRLARVSERVSTATPEVRSLVEGSDYLQALLTDYDNVLYIDENGRMHNMLKSGQGLPEGELTEQKLAEAIWAVWKQSKEYTRDARDNEVPTKDAKGKPLSPAEIAKAKVAAKKARQDRLRRRFDTVKAIAEKAKQNQKLEEVKTAAKAGLPGGEDNPHLPKESDGSQDGTSSDPKADRKSGEEAVEKGGDEGGVTEEDAKEEYAAMKERRGARLEALRKAQAYVAALKSYGIGMAQTLKDARDRHVELHASLGPDHPETVRAEQELTQAVEDHQAFLGRVDTASVWAQFAVGAMSAIAKLAGDSEAAAKVTYYAGNVVNAFVSAAMLYAGDPRGAIGLLNSITALFGGMPGPSPEQQMLRAVLEQLEEIRKDLKQIKGMLHTLQKNIVALRIDVKDVQIELGVLAQLSQIQLESIQAVGARVRKLELGQILHHMEQQRMATGFSKVIPVVQGGQIIGMRAGQGYFNAIDDFAQQITGFTSSIGHTVQPGVLPLADTLETRSSMETGDGVHYASGVKHALSPFLRTMYGVLKQPRDLPTLAGLEPTTTGEDFPSGYLVNLVMWEAAAELRLAFMHRLREQEGLREDTGLNAFTRFIGKTAIINAHRTDVMNLAATLGELRHVAASNIVPLLIGKLVNEYGRVRDAYLNHPYQGRSESPTKIDLWLAKARTQREQLVRQWGVPGVSVDDLRRDGFPHGDERAEYSTIAEQSLALIRGLRHVGMRLVLELADDRSLENSKLCKVSAPDEKAIFFLDSLPIIAHQKHLMRTRYTMKMASAEGLTYPVGYKVHYTLGCNENQRWDGNVERGEANGAWVVDHDPGFVQFSVELYHGTRDQWDKALIAEHASFRFMEDPFKRRKVLELVDVRDSFQKIHALKVVLKSVFAFFGSEAERRSLDELLDTVPTQDALLGQLCDVTFVPWEHTFRVVTPDFSKFESQVKTACDRLRDFGKAHQNGLLTQFEEAGHYKNWLGLAYRLLTLVYECDPRYYVEVEQRFSQQLSLGESSATEPDIPARAVSPVVSAPHSAHFASGPSGGAAAAAGAAYPPASAAYAAATGGAEPPPADAAEGSVVPPPGF